MTKMLVSIVLTLGLVSAVGFAAEPGQDESLLDRYEQIRRTLLYDSVKGVSEAAAGIMELTRHASSGRTSGVEPVCSSSSEPCEGVLREINRAASAVRGTETLDDAREAFGELSRAFVKYREEITGPRPVVAYCSMARKVWLQPDGLLGNPYYGQSMAECGEIISN